MRIPSLFARATFALTSVSRQPEATRVFVGHDHRSGGRPVRFETMIDVSKMQLKQPTAADGSPLSAKQG